MAKFWVDFSKWLEDASKVISKEAGDLTLKGKLKLEMFELKRILQQQFAELGKLFYAMTNLKKMADASASRRDWKKDKKIGAVIAKIRNLQRQLRKKESDYKNIGK